jgi:galactitol-specific phosphotransferase system IIC component
MAMAWYDNVVKFSWPNVLVAVGVVVLAPVLLPVVGAVLRPVVKGAVKAGLTVKDMAVGFVAEAGEQVSDLVAEAKAEHYAKPEA